MFKNQDVWRKIACVYLGYPLMLKLKIVMYRTIKYSINYYSQRTSLIT